MQKKKFRWKRFAIWSLSIVIVLGVAGIFAVNYAIDRVMESMANSILEEIDLEVSSGAVASPTPASNPSNEAGGSDEQPAAPDNPDADSGVPSNKPAGQDGQPQQFSQGNGDKGNSSTNLGEYSSEVSVEKAKAIKENVTVSEKADVASILMGNLSLSDLKLFQQLASGGMTVDEKRQARKVLLDKLTPKEYEKLSKIAKKYGISRGLTYEEAQKEENSGKSK